MTYGLTLTTTNKIFYVSNESGSNLEDALFLIDFEFINQKQTGLDLIKKLELVQRAVLVTSNYEEVQIRALATNLNVQIIPKAMAGFVPIAVARSNDQTSAATNLNTINISM